MASNRQETTRHMCVSQLHNEIKTKKYETHFSLSSFIKNIFKHRWLPGGLLDDWAIAMKETDFCLWNLCFVEKEAMDGVNHMVY